MLGIIRGWFQRWRGPVTATPRPRQPRDPSGLLASGESQHMIVEEGAEAFVLRPRRYLAGAALSWVSTDTSVARLEVATDTRSARVRLVGPGTTTLRVSDGVSAESRQLVVTPKPQPQASAMGLTLDH